jgi:uncharacterized protein
MRLAWNGTPDWRAEVCEAVLSDDGVVATGAQLGSGPQPYRASYELEVRKGWITRRLRVEVAGVGSVELRHDGKGTWAGVPNAAELEGALDCDLAFSPLTNLMPVRRHRLHEEPGAVDFDVAWVALPELTVHRSKQHYEHLEPGRVRFTSGDFAADLEVDADGIVTVYPGLARRVS